jgi:hypothetical protein
MAGILPAPSTVQIEDHKLSEWIGKLFQFVSHRGALLEKTSNQTISNNVLTALTWSSTIYDTGNMSGVSYGSTSKILVPDKVVKVQINCSVRFESNATGFRHVVIKKTGAVSYSGLAQSTVAAANGTATVIYTSSPVIQVQFGDYFEVFVQQSSGGNLLVEASGNKNNWFEMKVIN